MKAFLNWVKSNKILTALLGLLIITVSIVLPISLKEKSTMKKPVELNNNECIVVGEDRFLNQTVMEEEIIKKTVTVKNIYELRRSSTEPTFLTDDKYVYVNGYYYYWNTQTTTTEIETGKLITETSVEYSYLPYKQNEELLLIQKTTVSQRYENREKTGWQEHTFQYELNLNSYFASFESLKYASKTLANFIDTSGKEKYYVEPSIPDTISYTRQVFKTYYYIEKI